MIITDKRKKELIRFESLEYGDCFVDENDDLYMKVYVPEATSNAVRLSTGRVFYFEKGEAVSFVKAELTIS